ncbi:MAG: hypothetical protein PHF86_05250 [Candidatus Nanoarchaeia archaeon]|jgi:hypothetical protein|nr:hypothetical protein [Candidatus Nanoarchaeia archaeon]
MQITPRLQTEIVEYLWQEMNNLPKGPQLTNESNKNDVIAAAMSRGVRLGMSRAITIINYWNKPNKGKVHARLNSSQEIEG